ncbi:uncharacterized protein LOC143377446 [Andrena cerasifolii]|uniref:uncharacterized protein LOC143377446 n=1 Tax=Andrena cerasifolii TaxID=2819439 RepID=UPI00403816D5
MGKQMPKMSARVVSAIRNLRETHGSTSKEIMNYIASQYSAPEPIIQRQMHAALKRGLDYGILKRHHGHYFLNADADVQQLASTLVPVERSRRRRRMPSRRRRGSSRRRRSYARKRRRSSGRRRRRSRSRRRSRRRRSRRLRRGKRAATKLGTMGCTRCRCTAKKSRDTQDLRSCAIEPAAPEDDMCVYRKESDVERRSRHSKSRDRSLSRSRSSANSDRDAADDRQAIRDQD